MQEQFCNEDVDRKCFFFDRDAEESEIASVVQKWTFTVCKDRTNLVLDLCWDRAGKIAGYMPPVAQIKMRQVSSIICQN